MTLSTDSIAQQLTPFLQAPRWLVAYSGGVDSTVLLQLLAALPDRPPLLAVHINHGIQAASDDWERHCSQQATALGVDLQVERLALGAVANLEERARDARYRCFEALVGAGEVLMMAHHLDDQMETLLLRMLRGSGSRGLSAIPPTRPLGRGLLHRPLLHWTRGDIEDWARRHRSPWVEDPSNRGQEQDRNFLRNRVLPVIAGRWPDYRATFDRVIALSEESEQLNRELAELDCHALSVSPLAESLPISALSELSPVRRNNLLRYWLRSRQLPLPTAAQMAVLQAEVIEARRDAEPLLQWPGVQVRRFRDELYAMAPLADFDDTAVLALGPDADVYIPGVGVLQLQSAQGAGIRASALAPDGVSVRFRRGGERCQPAGRSGSRSLKKLLQEYGVETWLRDRVPLLYQGQQLLAVGDYWVCEGYSAAPGEPGFSCHWQRRLQLDHDHNNKP